MVISSPNFNFSRAQTLRVSIATGDVLADQKNQTWVLKFHNPGLKMKNLPFRIFFGADTGKDC